MVSKQCSLGHCPGPPSWESSCWLLATAHLQPGKPPKPKEYEKACFSITLGSLPCPWGFPL